MGNSRREVVPPTRGAVLTGQAPFYDVGCALAGLGKSFRRETLHHARLGAGDKVLDVGCGTGILTQGAAEIAGPSGEVVGTDPSAPMISLARRNAARARHGAIFQPGVIEQLSFQDKRFDVVLSSLMLHHLPPALKREGLREIHRVLKPGGRLLAVDLDRPGRPLWWLAVWPQLLMPNLVAHIRGDIPRYLHEAGFCRVQTVGRWLNLLTFWEAGKR